MPGPFGVASEVGRLRKVIVHRPDLSLRRLTPNNRDELLFDDLPWVSRAQAEHDEFVAMLRGHGVQVYHHQTLLAEALQSAQARRHAVERTVTHLSVGPALLDPVREELAGWDGETLARHLIGGLTKAEFFDLVRGRGTDLDRRSLVAAL